MKSKISFFNKTIFFKNLKLFFPIWTLYFIFLLWKLPVSLWYELNLVKKEFADGAYVLGQTSITQAATYNICNDLDFTYHGLVIFGVAIICAMSLFNYIFNSKSANMYHALPVSRRQLFGTNVISGLLFMWVPQLINFMIAVLVCIANQFTVVKLIGYWLIYAMTASLTLYAIAVFCAMFTGQWYALPIYYVIVNFFEVGFCVICAAFFNLFAVGVYCRYFNSKLTWMSPAYYFIYNMNISAYYPEEDSVVTEFIGRAALPAYAVLGLILLIISYYLYKNRKIECAGDFISFKIIRPIFRWGLGVCMGIGIVGIVHEILSQFRSINSVVVLAGVFILISLIAFYIGEMLIEKKFMVLNKRLFKESLVYLVFLGVVFSGFYKAARVKSTEIPDENMVDCVYVVYDYPITISYDEAVKLQKNIVNNFAVSNESDSSDYASLEFDYILKDGTKAMRSYNIEYTEASNDALSHIFELTEESDKKLAYAMGPDASALLEHGESGEIEHYNSESMANDVYTLEAEQMDAVTEALIKDIKEGNLDQYIIPQTVTALEKDNYIDNECSVTLTYIIDDPASYMTYMNSIKGGNLQMNFINSGNEYDANTAYYYEYFDDYMKFKQQCFLTKNMTITAECDNILQTLIDLNVIDSAQDLGLAE